MERGTKGRGGGEGKKTVVLTESRNHILVSCSKTHNGKQGSTSGGSAPGAKTSDNKRTRKLTTRDK